jgi:predicted NUDIX family NTP pyrophosphohydrolase
VAQVSAGLLVFRRTNGGFEFLLVHPGGPFWRNRDEGAWSIPKGLIDEGEDHIAAARREFAEETSLSVNGELQPLTPLRQKSGKWVHAFLVEGDFDLAGFRSNVFAMEWPRRSGRMIEVPEADRAAYFSADEALKKILPGQTGFITEALAQLNR